MKMRAWVVWLAFVPAFGVGAVLAESWHSLYNESIRDLEAGRYEAAIAKLKEAVRQKPESGQQIRVEGIKTIHYFPYYLLGKAYFHARKYEEAARFLARESQSNPPEKLSEAIVSYQQAIKSIQDRERLDEFNQALAASEAARKQGVFVQAAELLEKARKIDQAEFAKRGLDGLLDSVRESERSRLAEMERQRTEEAERQRIEAAFKDLVRQASEKERRGAVGETTDLLLKAEQLSPGRSEVETLRNRIKEREEKYASAKQAASVAENEGRITDALGNLHEAEQAYPERYKAESLAARFESLTWQVEIQNQMSAATAALEQGQYARAVENYDLVLGADPEHALARIQRSQAQFLQLLTRGQELADEKSFPDAFKAFELARSEKAGQGPQLYDRMRPYVQDLRAARSPIEKAWLDLMRSSDPERFAKERLTLASTARASGDRVPQRSQPPKQQPETGGQDNVRNSVLAALNVEPQEAIRMLEAARAAHKGGNAELESWTGVAYARLSFLTADPKRKEELRAKATKHFKRALDLDPRHRLNSRLVPPRILQLFAEARP